MYSILFPLFLYQMNIKQIYLSPLLNVSLLLLSIFFPLPNKEKSLLCNFIADIDTVANELFS